MRVSYKVTAQDAVDGAVPVTCTPPPGSRFKVGRTKVTCTTGTDSSGNTAMATFTITVKRRHLRRLTNELAMNVVVAPPPGT